jgi:hypothetical protein
MKLVLITLFTLSLKFGNANHHQLPSTIRPNTNEATQQQAAMDVIRRLINDRANDVAIKINFNLPGNYFKVRRSLISFHLTLASGDDE